MIKAHKKYYILGEGTNIIPPSFYDGLILKVDFNNISNDNNLLSVGASYNWSELVAFCIKENINGFENLIDIPGSVGASPIQNIGAYGAEVSRLIDSIDYFCLDSFSKKSFGPVSQSDENINVLDIADSIKTKPGSSHKEDSTKQYECIKYSLTLSL